MTATGIATSDICPTSNPTGCLSLRAGEAVTIVAFDTDSPEYVWCTTAGGAGGWVPTAQLMVENQYKPVTYSAPAMPLWQGQSTPTFKIPMLASLRKIAAADQSIKSSARRVLVSILEGVSHGKQVLIARPYVYGIIASFALLTRIIDLL